MKVVYCVGWRAMYIDVVACVLVLDKENVFHQRWSLVAKSVQVGENTMKQVARTRDASRAQKMRTKSCP